MRALPLLILLGACAADTTQSESRDQRALREELAGLAEGPPESCAPARQNESLQIVDRETLVLRSGNTIWVNRLDGSCPGLRPLATLIVEAHGSRYCRGDRVRALEPQSTIPGPVCILRDFIPYRRGS